jgi:hypothetical protein
MEERIDAYRVLVGEPGGKKPLEIPRSRREVKYENGSS